MNSTPHILDNDIKKFCEMSDELNQYHADKFILVFEGRFISSFDTFDNAARYAVKNFGKGPYLIRQVGAPTEMSMPASVKYRPHYADS